MKLRFELASDEGLQFGGWTIDDVCIVKKGAAPNPSCGNGVIDAGETCDDGNRIDGDGCSASCTDETGGGSDDADATNDAGGCCSSGGGAAGAFGLSALTLGLALRRRATQRSPERARRSRGCHDLRR
ncbi:MAG: DUF4215 domain-containing protein [Deltaproteobacteria bacterium]|nr:DUF4215 domain-containing protein [Deltaproteobacteria bacterium]